MLDLLAAPAASEPPTWTDRVEAWSTLGGAIVAFVGALVTFLLLVHQIKETRRARSDADAERTAAAADRGLARQDRQLAQEQWELAREERQDQEATQARAVVVGDLLIGDPGSGPEFPVEAPVWNYSPEPLLNLTVVLADAVLGRLRLGHVPLVAPATRVSFTIRVPTSTDPDDFVDMLPEIFFTDSNGRQWRRQLGHGPERPSREAPEPGRAVPKASETDVREDQIRA